MHGNIKWCVWFLEELLLWHSQNTYIWAYMPNNCHKEISFEIDATQTKPLTKKYLFDWCDVLYTSVSEYM